MAGQALNEPAEIPAELDRWNWGAFFLNWIWGIGNSTFIALLALIPFVNIIMIIVLGARGSRWAWRNRAWRDAEQFRKTQRNWAIAGLVVWVVGIGGYLNVDANGAGEAQFSIPVHGAKGKGTVFSTATRTAGTWSLRLLVVKVEGVDAPIVLLNEDHVPIPNAAIGI